MQTVYPSAPEPAAAPCTADPRADLAHDERAVRASLARMVAAWNAGDAAAYAREFAADATYVIYAGTVSEGRAAIEAAHAPVFERWQRGSRMSMRIRGIRFIGPDAAVVLTEGGVGRGRADRIRRDKVQTYAFARGEDGVWRCAAFQNTKVHRLFARMTARATARFAASAARPS